MKMYDVVAKHLMSIELGEPQEAQGVTVFPLFAPTNPRLEYVALKTALDSGTIAVSEVTAAGVVGDLRVRNGGSSPVLLLDGEELAGAKQNRVLNTTILVGAHTETIIPVSCTEQGRWSYVSSRFQESHSVAPPRVRRATQRTVNASLAREMTFRADQGEVWEGVHRMAADAGVHSETGAMRDVFQARMSDLDALLCQFCIQPGQRGLLAVAGDGVLGFDLVSRSDVYAVLHTKLVRSYAMDALLGNLRPATRAAGELAKGFLLATSSTDEKRYKSVGHGYDYRYTGEGMVGSAIAFRSEVVHTAFFAVPREESSASHAYLRSHVHRRGFRL
ncbi:MAG: hypothetical protein IMY84_05780 [Chloroflexi bacterium]|nr:hypothetical protein [Chloroflexota bacterium]